MGHTTGKRHLRRISAPRTWPIPRKGSYWVVKPSPGPWRIDLGMPLILWIRDYLKYAKTAREVRYILVNKKVYLNGKPVKDPKFPAGLFDVISFPDLGENYRVIMDSKGRLQLKLIDEKEANLKITKIIRKQIVKKGKVQVTGFDGRNFLLDDPKSIKTGDSLLIGLPDQEIIEKIPMEENTLLFFYYGAKVGTLGRLKEVKILRRPFGHTRIVIYEDLESREIKESIWEYTIPIGKETPVITVK